MDSSFDRLERPSAHDMNAKSPNFEHLAECNDTPKWTAYAADDDMIALCSGKITSPSSNVSQSKT